MDNSFIPMVVECAGCNGVLDTSIDAAEIASVDCSADALLMAPVTVD